MEIIECKGYVKEWNEYVENSQYGSVYHLIEWKEILEKTFGYKAYYLLAKDHKRVKGILPLLFIKSLLFGRYLVSLPFVDFGGIIADDQQTSFLLIDKAIEIASKNRVNFVELRNYMKVESSKLLTRCHKVTFILRLDSDPNYIWRYTLSQNVRNKIRKATKYLSVDFGNDAFYIYQFYRVYTINMRNLGTPPYPLDFFLHMCEILSDKIKVFVAKYKEKVISAKIVLFYKDTMYFIFHSSLRSYWKFAPNNFLYWAAIEYACKNGYKFCNMGRSTINSGPFVFKRQWGGEMKQLYWQYYLNKTNRIPDLSSANPKFSLAKKLWRRLPLKLTTTIGPFIAKNIL